MRFSQDDSKLFTSSMDTSIIVWDIISESSLFKSKIYFTIENFIVFK